MYCKCLRERSGPSTFLQLLLHKGPLSICVQLIYLGWFQHSDIPTCRRGPGLTCAGHGDRHHSPFGAASVQPGAPVSVLQPFVGQQGSQIAPGTQNCPTVPPASSLLSARAQLGQRGAELGAHPGPSSSWPPCRSQSQPSRPWLSGLAAAGH